MIQTKDRIEYLKKIGISEPLIRMAQGEIIHSFFESAYEEPEIFQVKNLPNEVTPLWQLDEFKTLIFEKDNKMVFAQVNLEDPDATLDIIGFTEQAALARLFIDNIEVSSLETSDLIREVKGASECSGFKYSQIFIDLLKLCDENEDKFFRQFNIFQKRIDW